MSSKEVKDLRKSGKLEEALHKAKKNLKADPDDIWNKRLLAWVYYDYSKLNADPDNFESFVDYLDKIIAINLPENDTMIFDKLAYQIAKIVYAIYKITPVQNNRINQLFYKCKEKNFSKPGEGYSALHKAFLYGYKDWSGYIAFADWWNIDNLRDEDYQPETFNNRKQMALAEKVHIAYSKKLLEELDSDTPGISKEEIKEKIKSFMPRLDNLIETS